MKMILLIFISITCLAAADIDCPDGKLSCPSGKVCCLMDGQYNCCDPESEQEGKMRVFAGLDTVPSHSYPNSSDADVQHGLFGCLFCEKTCCKNSFCCPLNNAYCCSSTECCPNGYRCCSSVNGCCPVGTKCCRNGDAKWCCRNRATCGFASHTCFGTGVTFTPALTTLTVLFFITMASKKYFN